MCLLAAIGFTLLLSGCGLIEEVDGPRREDFATSPAVPPQQDQHEAPVTAADLDPSLLEELEEPAPALEQQIGLEPDLVDVHEQAPVVPR